VFDVPYPLLIVTYTTGMPQLRIKKVCHPWMTTYNTDDKTEQCSNYSILWFCS